MVAESTRSRFAVYGVVPSVIVHVLIVLGLYFTPEPEEEPDCPSQEEACRAICAKRPLPIPEACPKLEPCRCDVVPLELMEPELLAELVLPPEPEVAPAALEPPVPEPAEIPPPPEEVESIVEEVASARPRRAARKRAVEEARAVGVARILGTYGDGNSGTLEDVLAGGEATALDELFAEGMTTSKGGGVSLGGGEGGQLRERRTKGHDADVESAGRLQESTASLSGIVGRKLRGLQKCYERALIEAGVEGKITVELHVEGGKPTKVEVTRNTAGSTDLRDCVIEKAEAWSFDSDVAGETSFSVVFRSE